MTNPTRFFRQSRVRELLTMEEALPAVESAFAAYGRGEVQMPPKSYLYFDDGDLRCMPCYLPETGLATVKNVNVHPHNEALPTVMATVTVFDPDTGFPLAIMDGTHLTAMRTGAAGGIAAKYLARPDSGVAAFVGAGQQAATQLEALMLVFGSLGRVLASDLDEDKAEEFARRAEQEYGVSARACGVEEAVREADIITTVTPSRGPVVRRQWVRPGTHINAIGADAPGKQELESALVRDARVVIDSWDQALHSGEVNVPLSEGVIGREDIYADIGEVVTGQKKVREGGEPITIFDSTGLAIQDAACAATVYRRAGGGGEVSGGDGEFDFLG
ncbi:MAG: ornithine cyclodeaminase family protein [Planctomycetota bacterium]